MNIRVGMVIESKINSPEGVQVNLSDSGLDVLVLFQSPSKKELEVFRTPDTPFQMKVTVEEDVIFFLLKFGELPWMDAPFSVHLCTGLTQLPIIEQGHGLAMRVYLFDTKTGKIEAIRILGLTNSISNLLLRLIKEQKEKSFGVNRHIAAVNKVYSTRTTEQLLNESIGNCVL